MLLVIILLAVPLYNTYRNNPLPLYGFGLYTVLTGSMEPTIPTGSLMLVRSVEPGSISRGDILTFRVDSGEVVTHRVTKVAEEDIVTKGDANNAEDTPIHYGQVIGRAVLWLPGAGALPGILKTPYLWFGVVFLAGLAMVLAGLRKKPDTPKAKETSA